MVQLMKNGNPDSQNEKTPMVKTEMEDPLEEEHGPLSKRHKVFFILILQSVSVCVYYLFLLERLFKSNKQGRCVKN